MGSCISTGFKDGINFYYGDEDGIMIPVPTSPHLVVIPLSSLLGRHVNMPSHSRQQQLSLISNHSDTHITKRT